MTEKYIEVAMTKETYNYLMEQLKKDLENAEEMSEVPGQRWKQAWKEEMLRFARMINTTINFGEYEEISEQDDFTPWEEIEKEHK